MTNSQVVWNWRLGKIGKSSNGNLSTDGLSLYSYNMLIGTTEYFNNKKYSLNVMSPNFYSATTSQHCSLAKSASDEVIEPISRYNWFYFPQEILDKSQFSEYRNL
jgi:hypothetical protein